MFKLIYDHVWRGFSGERAKRHVEELVRHHRIQASPGLRAAAEYCYDHFRSLKLATDILRFAGDGTTRYGAALIPQEWECQAATLHLVTKDDPPRLLADFAEEKIAVIQRSSATPPEGVEAEVVALDTGVEEKDYADLDVRGKLVLTKGDLSRVHDLAVQRRGALGIIYDGMREEPPVRPPLDLAEARQYTSFWWRPEDTRCFGFVLSPRQGEELRRIIRSARLHGESARLRAVVRSRFTNGHLDAPTAVLPGRTDEEILLVAHICHPQPSANDNASGVAALLETARVLCTLVESGQIPALQRSIRFLLPPEIYGTQAYVTTEQERAKLTVAALNLDMVGENQEECGSSFLVERPPQAMAAPVDALALAIQDALAQEQKGFSDLGAFALFRYGTTPFNGGSDHMVLADPTVGIPCPMLIQWPDRFYHTTFDTVDKVAPASLKRAGVLAATYGAFLATAGAEEAAWLAHDSHVRYKALVARIGHEWATAVRILPSVRSGKVDEADAQRIADQVERLRRRLLYLAGRHHAALAWLERLGGAEIRKVLTALQSEGAVIAWAEVTAQTELITGVVSRAGLRKLPEPAARVLDRWEKEAQEIVPIRRFTGYTDTRSHLSRLASEKRDAWYAVSQEHKATPSVILSLALYWMDGQRSLLDIADLVELETGVRDVAYMVKYIRLLRELELLEYARSAAGLFQVAR